MTSLLHFLQVFYIAPPKVHIHFTTPKLGYHSFALHNSWPTLNLKDPSEKVQKLTKPYFTQPYLVQIRSLLMVPWQISRVQ